MHEITKILNTAEYSYSFVKKDQNGNDVPTTLGGPSNTVEATLPLVESIRIPMGVAITPVGDTTTFVPNSIVNYEVSVKNESTTQDFQDPICLLYTSRCV